MPTPTVITAEPERPAMPPFTPAQIDAILAHIQAQGEARARMGSMVSDVEFFCGAASVLEAIGLWGSVPPIWTISAMSGRRLFGFKPSDEWFEDEDTNPEEIN